MTDIHQLLLEADDLIADLHNVYSVEVIRYETEKLNREQPTFKLVVIGSPMFAMLDLRGELEARGQRWLTCRVGAHLVQIIGVG